MKCVRGDISYIQEEVSELEDAHRQNISYAWKLIEASDVVGAVGKYSNKHLGAPLLLVLVLTYLRIPYKIVRNAMLNLAKVDKSKYFEEKVDEAKKEGKI